MENPATWDWERADLRKPSKDPQAVVSVRFTREQFTRISLCAQRLGVTTSAFVRRAALLAEEAAKQLAEE